MKEYTGDKIRNVPLWVMVEQEPRLLPKPAVSQRSNQQNVQG